MPKIHFTYTSTSCNRANFHKHSSMLKTEVLTYRLFSTNPKIGGTKTIGKHNRLTRIHSTRQVLVSTGSVAQVTIRTSIFTQRSQSVMLPQYGLVQEIGSLPLCHTMVIVATEIGESSSTASNLQPTFEQTWRLMKVRCSSNPCLQHRQQIPLSFQKLRKLIKTLLRR